MGDFRTYAQVTALRAVMSQDAAFVYYEILPCTDLPGAIRTCMGSVGASSIRE